MERKKDWWKLPLAILGASCIIPTAARAQENHNSDLLTICLNVGGEVNLDFSYHPQVMVNGALRDYGGSIAIVNQHPSGYSYLKVYGVYKDNAFYAVEIPDNSTTPHIPKNGWVFSPGIYRHHIKDLQSYTEQDLKDIAPEVCHLRVSKEI